MSDTNTTTGWVKLYVGSVLVTLPVPTDRGIAPENAQKALQAVKAYIEAGFTPQPGEDGPQEKLSYPVKGIVRRLHIDKEGCQTPLIDVYTGGKYRFMGVYLNKPEDVTAFERAFAMRLEDVPLWMDGTVPIELGSPRTARIEQQFFLDVSSKNVRIAYVDNPKYDPNAEKKMKKAFFRRWVSSSGVQTPRTEKRPADLPEAPAPRVPASGNGTSRFPDGDPRKVTMTWGDKAGQELGTLPKPFIVWVAEHMQAKSAEDEVVIAAAKAMLQQPA